MSRKTALRIFHGLLMAGFLAAAGWAIGAWLTTDNLEGTVVGATVAAFFATFSTFVDRIFPMDD